MIDLKTAAAIAINFVQDIYPKNTDFQVEEIETTEDGKYWLLTVGMYDLTEVTNPLGALISKPRKYKAVQINKETGNIQSMKIRKV